MRLVWLECVPVHKAKVQPRGRGGGGGGGEEKKRERERKKRERTSETLLVVSEKLDTAGCGCQ